jgi:hypothetical protein
MNALSPSADHARQIRRWASVLLITLTAGLTAGRILSAELVIEPSLHKPRGATNDPRPRTWPDKVPTPMPTYSSNDRARWATVRALVDHGTYAIGERNPAHAGKPTKYGYTTNQYGDIGIVFDDPSAWGTVDKVLDPQTKRFYASKPPLLSTVIAGEYWLLQQLFGWTLEDNPFEVVRTILFTVNWLPMILYLIVLSWLVERLAVSDWTRLFVLATACLGTFLTTFLTTLNNHTMAAFSVLFALYQFVVIWQSPPPTLPDEAGANTHRDEGATAATAPSPVGGSWWRFAVAGFFAAWAACNEMPAAAFGVALFVLLAIRDFGRTALAFVPAALVPIAAFLYTNYLAVGDIVPVQVRFGSEWYLYPGSHWLNPRGIDAAAEPKAVYAFHMLLGHHGIFSLSPVFLLSLAGMLAALFTAPQRVGRTLPLLALVLSLLVFAFYLVKTNNYGGWTSGLRWFFWLIPLWLLAMIPAADGVARTRLGRGFACVLLALSALSVAYPAFNPWRHPWLYNLLDSLGCVRY